MKFGDIVTCVASLAVILAVIGFPLELVLTQALGVDWGPTVTQTVSFLLTALIGGYIFAGKIAEARVESITKITVLAAVLWILYLANWAGIMEELVLSRQMFITVVMVLVLGFVGLYVGSMLRQPAKS